MSNRDRVACAVAIGFVLMFGAILWQANEHRKSHCGLLLTYSKTERDSLLVFATNSDCLHTWRHR